MGGREAGSRWRSEQRQKVIDLQELSASRLAVAQLEGPRLLRKSCQSKAT